MRAVFRRLRSEIANRPKRSDSAYRQMRLALQLDVLSDRAYRHITTEVDAFAAGEDAAAAFRRKARRQRVLRDEAGIVR
jgi:hypothetical protein